LTVLTCREFLDALCDYLEGVEYPCARLDAEQHLQNCTRCRIVCATTRQTIALYHELQAPPVPPELEARLFARIAACPRVGQKTARRPGV
jgi:predicted anti-sigma-YlaC factor YlaD